MANGHQMEVLIEQANRQVAKQGREAEMCDLMLAAFGYLAHEINKPQWYSLKRAVPIAFTAGGTLGAGILGAISRYFS